MPTKKKTRKKSGKKVSKNLMTDADIKRARNMYKDLELKLEKVRTELKKMMGHIPHCA